MLAKRTLIIAATLLVVRLVMSPATKTLAAAPSPRVDVDPQGTVKSLRQVTARFSEPMVPFGDLRDVQPPFVLDCQEPGRTRWVDSRTWVLDFQRELPAGVNCKLTLRSGIRTLGGRAFPKVAPFAFSTGGPAIVNSSPAAGDESIDEEQAFILVLDGEPDRASLLEHVYFAATGITERIGIRILEDGDRDTLAKTLWPGFLSGPWLVLQPRQRLPHDADVELVWDAGVRTVNGVATETEQRLRFKTRRAFEAQMRCQRENARANCVPLAAIALDFSAPIARELAERVVLRAADGRVWTARTEAGTPSVMEVSFAPPFPESSTLQLELPRDLRDDAGRELINSASFPMAVNVAAYPPLAKFAARFGIIEAHAAPALPVTVRNLEPAIDAKLLHLGLRAAGTTPLSGHAVRLSEAQLNDVLPWLRAVARAPRTASLFNQPPAPVANVRQLTLPKPNGADAFEVIGIPLERPGLYVVEIASARLGRALLGAEQKMYVQAAALVTNMAVHFKQGRENAIAWVTTLDTARPVEGARVQVRDCRGEVRWEGSTDPSGIAWMSGLPARSALPNCWDAWPRLGQDPENEQREYVVALNDLDTGLLISAASGDDFTFVHSEWQEGIEPWRFQLPPERWSGPALRHTVLDRPLFRAGETVHMKHVVRLQTLAGYALPGEADLPAKVTIRHLGSNDTYDLPVQWRANGTADSTWTIPPGAKLGRYSVQIPDRSGNTWGEPAAELQVQEFRVPLMRADVGLPAGPLVAPDKVSVDLSLQYLNGGGAGGAPVIVRSQLASGRFTAPATYESFSFGNGRIPSGTSRRGNTDEEPERSAADTKVLQREQLDLDSMGAARTAVRDLPVPDHLRRLTVEMEFRDPNGETQTARSDVELWPAAHIAGIQVEHWVGSSRSVRARVVVLKPDGSPAPDTEVRVGVLQRTYYSARKRLVGGFYAYEDVTDVSAQGDLCTGRTDSKGEFECTGETTVDGNLILQADAIDGNGRISSAHDEVWVSDESEWRFPGSQSDRIDLLPERPTYEPGETARLQVRMPFRSAAALVTVEREGVAAAWVTELDNRNSVVSVPIQASHAPNVFVSVFVVRGRSGEVQPTTLVDLGRPSFKLGVAELRVARRAHELSVAVETDRQVYRVREQATAHVRVRTVDGSGLPSDAEVAVAAVDEGLLELLPNKSWDLLDVMTGRRGYGVRTATAQMQVVGKRHYGLKALPQGGGGGRQGTRELFDTLLLWQARVPLDGDGRASVAIPLNDSLSSFRIVAVATAGAGQFGSGATVIRSTQELMLLSGLPRVARHGDNFPAQLTVRNTSNRRLAASVRGTVAPHGIDLLPQELQLEPGEAGNVSWPFTVPDKGTELRYSFSASAGAGLTDELQVTQRVRPVVPVRTLQATVEQVTKPQSFPVQRPAEAVAGRGGISVTVAPRLAGALSGVREAMAVYPYQCLEQRVSRAIALNDEQQWQAITAELPSYTDNDGLLKYFPALGSGSDTLTAYVLSISQAANKSLPPRLQERLERGLQGFVDGSIERESAVSSTDLPLRKLAALAALARTGKANPALLSSIPTDPQLWPLSALIDWWTILDQLRDLPNRERQLRLAEQVVRQRLDLQGSAIALADSKREELHWLMADGDVSAARLLLHVVDTKGWPDDIGRLARGVLARQQRGRWSTTVANAWATVAFDHFSKRYEARPVTGTTSLRLDDQEALIDWSASVAGGSALLPWPPGLASLQLSQTGTGAPWATILSQAAIPLREPLRSGYRIERTITPIEVREPGRLHSGDVVRVRLDIEAQSDMSWVVVDDPIPTGAVHLAAGYGRESTLLTGSPTPNTEREPSFAERGESAYRAYFEFLPRGPVVVEYNLRLNQAGRFLLPPTRVEALYAPEMFAELPSPPVTVEP